MIFDQTNPYLLLLSHFFISLYAMEDRQRFVPIDASHSIIYTSPLLMGSNLSNLLKEDSTGSSSDCITTVGNGTSWVLIDLGFVVTGISQIRLYGDNFNEDTHIQISNVEILMAEIFPLKSISDLFQIERSPLTPCGNTGTVSKFTFNAVVTCKLMLNVRWILLKKLEKLNLCHINVLQHSVTPHCYFPVQGGLNLSKDNSKFEVFTSMRHFTLTECFQNCNTELQCEGIAFVPISMEIGICQLLKIQFSTATLFCDEMCQLFINLCHLGEKIEINVDNKDAIISLSQIKSDSYVFSLEISGELMCKEDYCGKTSIFIQDYDGKVWRCGKIDSLKFRVLVNEVFFCEKPIKKSMKLVFKNDHEISSLSYRFQSIYFRIVKEKAFILDIIRHVEIRAPEYFFRFKKTSRMFKFSTSKQVKFENTNIKFPTTLKIPVTLNEKINTDKSISISTNNISSIIIPKRSVTENDIFSRNYSKNAISTNEILSRNLSKTSLKYRSYMKGDTRIDFSEGIENQTKSNVKDLHKRHRQTLSTAFPQNITKSIIRFHTSANMSMNSIFLKHVPLPYMWIIIVNFFTIFILVTLIVICISFLGTVKKRKFFRLETVPHHGSFPLSQNVSNVI